MGDEATGVPNEGSSSLRQLSAAKVRISSVMNNVLTIVYQNKNAELFKGIVDLSKLNYKSNLGVVIASMLQALGYAWSEAGKKLWRRAEPDGALPYYIPPSQIPPPLSASLSGSPQPKPLPSGSA